MVKNLPVSAESTGDAGSIPGRKEPLAEEITHSSILAREIPRTERTHTTNSIRSSSYGFRSVKNQKKKKKKSSKLKEMCTQGWVLQMALSQSHIEVNHSLPSCGRHPVLHLPYSHRVF